MGFQLPGGGATGILTPGFHVPGIIYTRDYTHPGRVISTAPQVTLCGRRGGWTPNGCFLIETWVGLEFSQDQSGMGVHILLHVLVTTHEKFLMEFLGKKCVELESFRISFSFVSKTPPGSWNF